MYVYICIGCSLPWRARPSAVPRYPCTPVGRVRQGMDGADLGISRSGPALSEAFLTESVDLIVFQSRFLHKFVDSFFLLVMIPGTLTDLCGFFFLQNDYKHAL